MPPSPPGRSMPRRGGSSQQRSCVLKEKVPYGNGVKGCCEFLDPLKLSIFTPLIIRVWAERLRSLRIRHICTAFEDLFAGEQPLVWVCPVGESFKWEVEWEADAGAEVKLLGH